MQARTAFRLAMLANGFAPLLNDCKRPIEKGWPKKIYQRRRRPLAIGIDQALIAQLEPAIAAGHVTEQDISLALARYTGAEGYLANCVAGAARIGLDGKPAGAVTEKQAERAQTLVAKRTARRELNRNSIVEGKAAPGLGPTRPVGEVSSKTAPSL